VNIDFDGFVESLKLQAPPALSNAYLLALWWAGRGHWQKAHELVQDDDSPAGAWVHAHLHRQEGDDGNAAYWYRRAGQPVCRDTIEREWSSLVKNFMH